MKNYIVEVTIEKSEYVLANTPEEAEEIARERHANELDVRVGNIEEDE